MAPLRRLLGRLFARRTPPSRAWIYPFPAQRALYFAVPKVACTTWLRICCRTRGIDLDAVEPSAWFDAVPQIGAADLGRFDDWLRFGFVRNPWDRLVSCYLSKILPSADVERPSFRRGIPIEFERFGVFHAGMSFDAFARAVVEIPDRDADGHFCSQHPYFTSRRGRPLRIDRLERFEDAPDACVAVLDALGLPHDDLPHDKLSAGRLDYADYYDDALAERVGARYAEDVARYGYRFERPHGHPAVARSVGPT